MDQHPVQGGGGVAILLGMVHDTEFTAYSHGALRDDTKNGCVADYATQGIRVVWQVIIETLQWGSA